MKQKLNAKDFILIGVLTALMWIICMITVSYTHLKQKYIECVTAGYLPLVLYYGTDRIIREVPRRGHIKNFEEMCIRDSIKAFTHAE